MSALKDIENALGLFDLEQMGEDVINEVFRNEDEIYTDEVDRMNYFRDGFFLGSMKLGEQSSEANFTARGKFLLIEAIEKRLNNIKKRIAIEAPEE